MSFAYHLLHHWDRLFNSDNMFEVSDNIKTEHEDLQQLRGPGFCVAQKSLLQGAVQLALIFKSIQISRSLCNNDDILKTLLNSKNFMQTLFILEEMKSSGKSFSSLAERVLSVLKNRATLESAYFEEFALEIPHYSILLWNINALLSSNPSSFTQDELSEFIQKLNNIINQYRSVGSLNQSFVSDLDELYFEVNSKSILSKIQDALNNPCPHQDELFEKETQKKMHDVVNSNESNQVKLIQLTEILLRLEIHFRIQKIEKKLFEVTLPEKDRETKRNEFNKLKKSIEGHLASLKSVSMDKRKLMKSYHLKLEAFEQTVEKPVDCGTKGRSTRRRFLSNPSSLKEFAKEQAASDDQPQLSQRTLKRNDSSSTVSRSRSTSKPDSPRRSLFSVFETSPKLSRNSEKAPNTASRTSQKSPKSSPRQSLSAEQITDLLPQLTKPHDQNADTSTTLTKDSKKTTQASPRQSLSTSEIRSILPQLSKSLDQNSGTSPRQSRSAELKTESSDQLSRASNKTSEKSMPPLPSLPTSSPILLRRRPSIPILLRNDPKKQTLQQIIASDGGSSNQNTETNDDKEFRENGGSTRLPEDDFFS